MEMKVGLTFAFMNLKKLAKIKAKWGLLEEEGPVTRSILHNSVNKRKMALGCKSQSRFVYSLRRASNACPPKWMLISCNHTWGTHHFHSVQCRTVDSVLLPDVECIPPMPDSHRW